MFRLAFLALGFAASQCYGWELTNYYTRNYQVCSINEDGRCEGFFRRVTPTGTELPTPIQTKFSTTHYVNITRTMLIVRSTAPIAEWDYGNEEGYGMTNFIAMSTVTPGSHCTEAIPVTTEVLLDIPADAASIIEVTRVEKITRTYDGAVYWKAYVPTGVAIAHGIYNVWEPAKRSCDFFEPYKTKKREKEELLERIVLAFSGIALIWLVGSLLLGFVEVAVNFRAWALGRRHFPPGIPYAHAATCIIPLAFVLYYRGWRRIPARNEEERKRLKEAWDETGAGTKWKLFWKHKKNMPGFFEDVLAGLTFAEALKRLGDRKKEGKERKKAERQAQKKKEGEPDVEKASASEKGPAPEAPTPKSEETETLDEKKPLDPAPSSPPPPPLSSSTPPQPAMENDEMDITEVVRRSL